MWPHQERNIMSTSTEVLTNKSKREFIHKEFYSKYTMHLDYIEKCFNKDTLDSIKEIGKYFSTNVWRISYKEIEIIDGMFLSVGLDDSEAVPTHLLEHHYQLVQEKEEAEAWVRMWANSVDSNEDFEAGLPGYDGNIKCTQAKEIHNKLKESDTFQDLLVRYGTYQLLERGN